MVILQFYFLCENKERSLAKESKHIYLFAMNNKLVKLICKLESDADK